MEHGKVKFFNSRDGKMFGFIVPDAGGREVFFHLGNGRRPNPKGYVDWHDINSSAPHLPNAGDRVVYDMRKLRPKDKGPAVEQWAFESEYNLVQSGGKLQFSVAEAQELLNSARRETDRAEFGDREVNWRGRTGFVASGYFSAKGNELTIIENETRTETDFCGDVAGELGNCHAMTEEELLAGLEGLSGEDDDSGPVYLEQSELKAPAGKFRLVLVDMVPMMAQRDSSAIDYYHWGDFDTLDQAKERSGKPEYGTSYIVYDDTGRNVFENSGLRNVNVVL